MSAAAPKAHRQSPDPDSTQPREMRGESTEQLGRAAYRQRQLSLCADEAATSFRASLSCSTLKWAAGLAPRHLPAKTPGFSRYAGMGYPHRSAEQQGHVCE